MSDSQGSRGARELFKRALQRNGGNRRWRTWKAQETEEIIELATQAERVELLTIDFEGDLNLVYRIRMPVPLWPQGDRLRIGSSAVFHLRYEEGWRSEGPAGWKPLGLLEPFDAFHPNMAPPLQGAICLGRALPAGIPVKEILKLGYSACTLQTVTLDEDDPDGVLNEAACEFYRQHPHYLPLTYAGLRDPWNPSQEEHR